MHGKFVLIKYIGRDFFQALCHCIVLMFQTESVKDRKCGKFSIGSRGCCNPPPLPPLPAGPVQTLGGGPAAKPHKLSVLEL